MKLHFLQCFAQGRANNQSFAHIAVAAFTKKTEPATGLLFGLPHGNFGSAQYFLYFRAIIGVKADPYAQGGNQITALNLYGLAGYAVQVMGQFAGFVAVCIRHDNHKIIPSQTGNQILPAAKSGNAAGNGLEQDVPTIVPHDIVDILQKINVKHQNSKGCLPGLRQHLPQAGG